MYHGWNGGWASGGYASGFPWGSFALAGLFLALLTLAILALVRTAKSGKRSVEAVKEHGFEILIERYARGEIDAETFRSMKTELESKA